MTDVEFTPIPAANLRETAASEVAAFRLINGEPSLDDIRHLTARVEVQMEPGVSRGDIEAEVFFATSQDRK